MNDPVLGIALIILLGLVILPMCYFTGASMIANLLQYGYERGKRRQREADECEIVTVGYEVIK